MNKMKLLLTLAVPVLLSQGAQGQTLSRLVAEAHWTNNGIAFRPMDSSAFSYSTNMRGGDLTHTLDFDNSTSWTFVGDSAFTKSTYWIQTFDANNNILTNTSEYWDGINWVFNMRTTNTYNSSNQVLTSVLQSWDSTVWVGVSEHTYTYSTGKMQSDVYSFWSGVGSTFVPSSEKIYSYDLSNTYLVNETDQNLTGGSPVYTNQYAYAYDTTTHQLLTTIYSTWIDTAWVFNMKKTNTYDTSRNLISMLSQNYNLPLLRWDNATLAIYGSFTSMGSNLPQTELDQVWNPIGSGTWDNQKMSVYTYNTYNQMTSSLTESYSSSLGAFEFQLGDPMANYYYQSYSPVAVNNVVNAGNSANIYPVPAQNTLRIDLNWNVAQSATIAIYDMQGRMVTPVINVPSVTEYRVGISVNNLAPGMYVVSINGTQDQIVKQIVVAH
jgi:type IX secretion system substrate protein